MSDIVNLNVPSVRPPTANRKRGKPKTPAAQFRLGMRLLSGKGINPDFQEGMRLLHSAADAGCSEAKHKLFHIYIYGERVEPDVDKAISFLRSAAADGLPDAEIEIGLMYLWGDT